MNIGQCTERSIILAALLGFLAWPAWADEHFSVMKTALAASELAVVVNVDDLQSEATSVYYQQRRGIPDENIIRVHLGPPTSVLPRATFSKVKAEVDRLTPANVQAYALAWTAPYRVDCMSITSAFAFGFDEAYCSAKQCANTRPSSYFDAHSVAPYTDFHMRPAMMLAGANFQDVKALILRGLASDHSYPDGTGYLLKTSDQNRNVRWVLFDQILETFKSAPRLVRLDADAIRDKSDVMFYFTGLAKVDKLKSLRFVPGAVADHLTSTGGQLTDSGQMSSLRWLEAGATGSYGAVVEPCNHLAKFPHPGVVIEQYIAGNSLIEAYWKSVGWPGEGVFIGEPLARPYEPQIVRSDKAGAEVRLYSSVWGNIKLETAPSPIGPFGKPEPVPVHPGFNQVKITFLDSTQYYRLSY